MPRADTITQRGGKNVDYYEISMRQFEQQILPAGLPKTTVWGYGAKAAQSKRGLLVHNAPSLTIEAMWNRPVRVKWINELVDDERQLPAAPAPGRPDPALGEPARRPEHRDTRPTFTETPGPYTGPVPIVTHVHGAVGVADDSDGYAEAWYLPAARNIPAGYATDGHVVRLLRRQGGRRLRRRAGARASPPSSTRTRTGRRRSGTTTTRSA